MRIDQAFNRMIDYYDDWMQKALPNYDDIYGTAKELLPFETTKPVDVLDLGAGTGLFSKHVLEKYPNARFLLYDLADQLLDIARDRFKGKQQQFKFIVGDYRKIEGDNIFDCVISSFSIHHLTHPDKKQLFHSVYRVLKEGGIFINIDQIRGETDFMAQLYWNHWLSRVRCREQDENRIDECIDRRKKYDNDATLWEQLDWLKHAGFRQVDCIYKNYFVGVFFAVKLTLNPSLKKRGSHCAPSL